MLQNQLPNEILFNIFKLLKREKTYDKTLAQCALTCQQWKQPAQAALYSALTINSTAVLDAIMNTPTDLGIYVQSITYCMGFCELSMIKIDLLLITLSTFTAMTVVVIYSSVCGVY